MPPQLVETMIAPLEAIGFEAGVASRLLATLVVVVIWFVVRALTRRYALRRIEERARRYVVAKSVSYVFGALLVVGLARVWLTGMGGLATFLGIATAGFAIALQEPILNLLAFAYILVRKPFVVGDRIELGDHIGDVIDIGMQHVTVVEVGHWVDADQSTGRLIHLPNGWVLRQSTANYTEGFEYVWNELPVIVTFESDWQRAKQLLEEIANGRSDDVAREAQRQLGEASHRFMIVFHTLTPIVWTKVVDNGVRLTVRYLCEVRKRRSSESELWEAILLAFAAEDHVDFAYPTTRFAAGGSFSSEEARPTRSGVAPRGPE